jgi:hypothetical protein
MYRTLQNTLLKKGENVQGPAENTVKKRRRNVQDSPLRTIKKEEETQAV